MQMKLHVNVITCALSKLRTQAAIYVLSSFSTSSSNSSVQCATSCCILLVAPRFRNSCALPQLLIKNSALSHICWFVSVTLFHTLLFLCFHILHNNTPNICFCCPSNFCKIEKTFVEHEDVVSQT